MLWGSSNSLKLGVMYYSKLGFNSIFSKVNKTSEFNFFNISDLFDIESCWMKVFSGLDCYTSCYT